MFGSDSPFGGSLFDNYKREEGSIFDKKDEEKSLYDTDNHKGHTSIYDEKEEVKHSMFDNPSYGRRDEPQSSLYDTKNESQGSIYDKKEEHSTFFFGADSDKRTSQYDLHGHTLEPVNNWNLGIMDDDKYKASYLMDDGHISSVNIRGGNHGNISLIDRMRGIQANRLDMDNEGVSIAEQYSDSALDKRAMGGMYNVTIGDIYSDKVKYMAHHGLMTDGAIDMNNNHYQVDTELGEVKRKSGFLATDYDMNIDTKMSISPLITKSVYEEQINLEDKKAVYDKKTYERPDYFTKNETPKEEEMSIFEKLRAKSKGISQMTDEEKMQVFNELSDEEKRRLIKDGYQPDNLSLEDRIRLMNEDGNKNEKDFYSLSKSEQAHLIKIGQAPMDLSIFDKAAILDEFEKEEKEKRSLFVGSGESKDDGFKNLSNKEKYAALKNNSAPNDLGSFEKNKIIQAEIDEFNKLSMEQKIQMLKNGDSPDELSIVEKDRLLREEVALFRELPLKEQLEMIRMGKFPERLSQTERDEILRAEALLFLNFTNKEKIDAIKSGKAPEKLTQEEINEILKEEADLRNIDSIKNNLNKKEEGESRDDIQKKIQEFRALSHEVKLQIIKDGKFPEGLPPEEKQKVLKDEQNIVEELERAEKKKERKAEEAQVKREKREAKEKAFIDKLREDNIRRHGGGEEDKDKEKIKKMSKKEQIAYEKRKRRNTDDDIILDKSILDNTTILEHFHVYQRNDNPLHLDEEESELLKNIELGMMKRVKLPELEVSSKNTFERFNEKAPTIHKINLETAKKSVTDILDDITSNISGELKERKEEQVEKNISSKVFEDTAKAEIVKRQKEENEKDTDLIAFYNNIKENNKTETSTQKRDENAFNKYKKLVQDRIEKRKQEKKALKKQKDKEFFEQLMKLNKKDLEENEDFKLFLDEIYEDNLRELVLDDQLIDDNTKKEAILDNDLVDNRKHNELVKNILHQISI